MPQKQGEVALPKGNPLFVNRAAWAITDGEGGTRPFAIPPVIFSANGREVRSSCGIGIDITNVCDHPEGMSQMHLIALRDLLKIQRTLQWPVLPAFPYWIPLRLNDRVGINAGRSRTGIGISHLNGSSGRTGIVSPRNYASHPLDDRRGGAIVRKVNFDEHVLVVVKSPSGHSVAAAESDKNLGSRNGVGLPLSSRGLLYSFSDLFLRRAEDPSGGNGIPTNEEQSKDTDCALCIFPALALFGLTAGMIYIGLFWLRPLLAVPFVLSGYIPLCGGIWFFDRAFGIVY